MSVESKPYTAPAPGCYRRVRDVRVLLDKEDGLAICAYPLRAMRLPIVAARLLAYCDEQRTGAEMAQSMHLPIKRIEALCEQLCRRGLLEAGPALPPQTWPCISILIPSRNRAAQLERCLRSLLALDYPAHVLEIVVVDDASTDGTRAMLQRFIEETAIHGWTIRLISHASQQGVGNGRNTAAQAASHALLAYIDSDCVASPNWLKELVPAFQDARTAAVGGMLRAYDRTTMLGRYEDVRSSLFMGVRPQEARPEGPLTYVPAANLLVRRAAWQQLEGFAPLNFGEDVDFCRRLLAAGYRVHYLPYGAVYHDYRTRLRDFLRTRVSYASSEAVLLQLHPHERRTLILPAEQAAFAALTIGGLWGIIMNIAPNSMNNHNPNALTPNTHNPIGADLSCAPPIDWLTWPMKPLHRFVWRHFANQLAMRTINRRLRNLYIPIILAAILMLMGAYRRWRQVRRLRVPVGPLAVARATLRGHLAYTYHLCRHLTRYYTLPMLLGGLLLPPVLPLMLIPCAVVIGVDYVRLRPEMGLGAYALCSLLDDCAYGVGVLQGCIKHRTWKPLLPVIRREYRAARIRDREY